MRQDRGNTFSTLQKIGNVILCEMKKTFFLNNFWKIIFKNYILFSFFLYSASLEEKAVNKYIFLESK